MNAMTGRGEARPLIGDRSTWICQDVAWRLLVIAMECDGECRKELEKIIRRLADSSDEALRYSSITYSALCDEWYLPAYDDVFSLGYSILNRLGGSIEQITDGLEETLPNTTAILGDALPPVVVAFAEQDVPSRVPLARRFAEFLNEEAPGPTAEVARYETAFIHPSSTSIVHDALYTDNPCGKTQWTIAPGVERLHFDFDILKLSRPSSTYRLNCPSRVIT